LHLLPLLLLLLLLQMLLLLLDMLRFSFLAYSGAHGHISALRNGTWVHVPRWSHTWHGGVSSEGSTIELICKYVFYKYLMHLISALAS
jgi:hypothetical protein